MSTSCVCWWVACIWPLIFPTFDRLHLFWIVPFTFVLPWIVNMAAMPARVRYHYHKGTPPNLIPDFTLAASAISVAILVAIMRLL
jgi:hypothetical protein